MRLNIGHGLLNLFHVAARRRRSAALGIRRKQPVEQNQHSQKQRLYHGFIIGLMSDKLLLHVQNIAADLLRSGAFGQAVFNGPADVFKHLQVFGIKHIVSGGPDEPRLKMNG